MGFAPLETGQTTWDWTAEQGQDTKDLKNNRADLSPSKEDQSQFHQISEMEQNLNDLQKDVSLFKDRRGWIVRFHVENNLLSQTGLKDNDLITFKQLQKLKEDPNKADLMTRLEVVMGTIQR